MDHIWIDGLIRLNNILNNCYNGELLLPDFIYGYNFTNSFVYNEQKN